MKERFLGNIQRGKYSLADIQLLNVYETRLIKCMVSEATLPINNNEHITFSKKEYFKYIFYL